MKSEKNWLNSRWLIVVMMLLLALGWLVMAGCTTVIPGQPKARGPSFDGGVRNSGFIGWTNVDLMTVGILTPSALARYNSLIGVYGGRFNPPIHASEGVCTNCIAGLILIQKQDLEHFTRMNRWRLEETK